MLVGMRVTQPEQRPSLVVAARTSAWELAAVKRQLVAVLRIITTITWTGNLGLVDMAVGRHGRMEVVVAVDGTGAGRVVQVGVAEGRVTVTQMHVPL
jgi:hypothetical protein